MKTEEKLWDKFSFTDGIYPAKIIDKDNFLMALKEYATQSTQPTEGKELKDITDEDAIEVAKILNLKEFNHQINEQGLTIYVGDWDDFNHYYISPDGDIELNGASFEQNIKVYQYLQSRGYKLPVYFPTQPTEKAVSDLDLIELFNNYSVPLFDIHDKDYRKKMFADLRALFSTPTEQSEAVEGWISVDEKLPEKKKVVMLYIPEYDNITTGYLDDEDELQRHCEFMYGDITHWKPLPQPPTIQIK